LAGAFAASLLVVALVLTNGGMLSQTTAASNAGWLMPVAAGLTAAGVAWTLTRVRSNSSDDAADEHTVTACTTCGGSVFDEWRLCPHCGTMLSRSRRARSA